MPQFSKHFVGIRYSVRSFRTVLNEDKSQFSNDLFRTTELWGGFRIKRKFQLMAFVPYNVNYSNTDDGVRANRGMGDVTSIVSYKLIDNKSVTKDTLSIAQQLWIGGGIKVPTGKFAVDTSEIVSSANNQAGTGSYDFLITAAYNLVKDNKGLVANVNYKINQSASDFKFGNRFTAAAFVFRSFRKNKNSISPNLGMLYENLSANKLSDEKIIHTGGYALLAAAGVEIKFDKINFGFNAQLPLASDMSDNQTKVNWRGMLHVSYAF